MYNDKINILILILCLILVFTIICFIFLVLINRNIKNLKDNVNENNVINTVNNMNNKLQESKISYGSHIGVVFCRNCGAKYSSNENVCPVCSKKRN